jgi:CO/xanthine dehydrogenase FAD-binding subunit
VSREFVKVTSIDVLLERLKAPDTAILCGGTDLIVKMKSGLADPKCLLDISDLEPLREIRDEDGRICIGTAVTESELLESPLIQQRLPLLSQVLSKLGSIQIRNRGTLGGNLVNASPAADSAIPLLLYDAEVVLQSADGERSLRTEEFLLGPGKTALGKGEFLREIVIPIPRADYTPFYHKVGRRKALTIAIASVGALLRMSDGAIEEIRLAAGSVAPTPIRLRRVEERMTGESLTPELIEEARALTADSVSPITDVRASADYRRTVTADLVTSFLEGAAGA